jgi:lantibiotic modifying enzyme
LLNHLNKHGFLELNVEHISSDFILGAIVQSNYFISDQNFDFLHGSAGICNLLVEFAGRNDVKNHLSSFVQRIFKLAIQTDKGYRFPFFYYHTEPASRPGIDAFSLAHGTCALQIILMKIHRAGIEKEKCEQLIFQSIDFMLHHENVNGSGGSLFPAYLDGKSCHSRVSWCYGDLNVAISLWQCGKYFNNELWKEKAIEILKYNTKRVSNELSGVLDVCLCHGSAGNAAMYMRMWHETKEPSFLKCAEEWYKVTGEMLQFSGEENVHGVRVWQGKDSEWQYQWDLLNGSSGTGLGLLSQSLDKPLPWDEFMLLS